MTGQLDICFSEIWLFFDTAPQVKDGLVDIAKLALQRTNLKPDMRKICVELGYSLIVLECFLFAILAFVQSVPDLPQYSRCLHLRLTIGSGLFSIASLPHPGFCFAV